VRYTSHRVAAIRGADVAIVDRQRRSGDANAKAIAAFAAVTHVAIETRGSVDGVVDDSDRSHADVICAGIVVVINHEGRAG
jgi:hypothetical protein